MNIAMIMCELHNQSTNIKRFILTHDFTSQVCICECAHIFVHVNDNVYLCMICMRDIVTGIEL